MSYKYTYNKDIDDAPRYEVWGTSHDLIINQLINENYPIKKKWDALTHTRTLYIIYCKDMTIEQETLLKLSYDIQRNGYDDMIPITPNVLYFCSDGGGIPIGECYE